MNTYQHFDSPLDNFMAEGDVGKHFDSIANT